MLMVLLASFVGSFGAVSLKVASGRFALNLKALLTNYYLSGGIALYLLSSYFFVLGVRKGELTILYPMVSLGYIWTLLWSRLFFAEPITRNKLFGLGLIVVGIILLQLGAH
jgi:multidrug transporter EmrE-like cation transporter